MTRHKRCENDPQSRRREPFSLFTGTFLQNVVYLIILAPRCYHTLLASRGLVEDAVLNNSGFDTIAG